MSSNIPENQAFSISGHWASSNFPGQAPFIFLSMNLQQTGGSVSGSGSFTSRPLSGSYQVSGSISGTTVSLQMKGDITFSFQGTVADENTIDGGFSGQVSFNRPLKRDSD